jgi:hypothetical protein
MPLIFYQALEERGYFLINDQLQLACISTDLQENAALHCSVACFSHLPGPNFNFKYKIEGTTKKKLKTIRGS